MKRYARDINQLAVFDEIFQAVLGLEQRRSDLKKNRENDRHVDSMIDKQIDEQVERYALVRICLGTDGYRLVYPGGIGSGTGPFRTRREAEAWFLGGGR